MSKVILVTGGNKGIGREVVRQLASRGHTVYLGARNVKLGETAANELRAVGDVRFIHIDMTDEATFAEAAAKIKKEAGHLDGLVNNAGISIEMSSPTKATLEAMRKTFETNYFGVVGLTQAMLPVLRAGQSRAIVNVSSELGSTTLHSVPEWRYHEVSPLAYNSSKAALNSFTVLLAKELRSEGFKVNSVNPGYVATDLNHHSGPGTAEDGAKISVHCVLLDQSGPTGGFFTAGGTLPW